MARKVGPAIFPGSFDPLTNGHVDVVQRTLNIFDRVIIALLSNAQKSSLFTLEERINLLREEFKSYGERVEVKSFSGLLVDFARHEGSRVVIRGLRAITDYDYETQMALMNKHLYDDLETLFLVAQESNSYVSSTLVKQVASLGGDVSKIVPERVLAALKRKFS
ncbi:MAG: pantetheine-phosphate adenylyltransferase [Oligoflexia bacterium]|nr:pantetheine-phosphate adenylyltransferase [Oligoflexia bacterium]